MASGVRMLGQRDRKAVLTEIPTAPAPSAKSRGMWVRLGVQVVTHVLGTADGAAVSAMASRELRMILRSRDWLRFLGMWSLACGGFLLIPLLYRSYLGSWQHPTGPQWQLILGYGLQVGI